MRIGIFNVLLSTTCNNQPYIIVGISTSYIYIYIYIPLYTYVMYFMRVFRNYINDKV